MNRRLRERNISQNNYSIAKNRLLEEIQDAIILNITPSVINKSIELLEKNTLRTIDSLHIACAIEWGADLFVSSDQKQIEAAHKAGLRVRFIESD